jgi:hypothetical protein
MWQVFDNLSLTGQWQKKKKKKKKTHSARHSLRIFCTGWNRILSARRVGQRGSQRAVNSFAWDWPHDCTFLEEQSLTET